MLHKYSNIFLVFFFLLLASKSYAQYYNAAFGKNGALLKTSLHNIIKGHLVGTYSDLWNSFYSTDKRNGNEVWDIYSDQPSGTPAYVYTLGVNQCGTYSGEGDCYNREHTWPQNYFNGQPPMYTDVHHIFPTDGHVNGKRGSFPYGKVNTVSWTSTNGSKTGSSSNYPGYTLDVFEPIDSFKGDLARVYFYVSTRYEGEDAGWLNWPMAIGAQLTNEAINLLLSWHHLDPVSQKEKDRNEAAYLIQNNRNPFIDYPIFADCIWGTGDCTALMVDEQKLTDRLLVFPNPAMNYIKLSTPAGIQINAFKIIDLSGRIIQENLFALNQIDLKNLERGNYILCLHTNVGVISKFFTKE